MSYTADFLIQKSGASFCSTMQCQFNLVANKRRLAFDFLCEEGSKLQFLHIKISFGKYFSISNDIIVEKFFFGRDSR